MATLMRWEPMKDLFRVNRDLDRMFDRFLSREDSPRPWGEEGQFVPAVESFVENGEVVVRMDVPGMEKSALDISVVGDTLTIKGDRTQTDEVNGKTHYLKEICYGKFERSLRLSREIPADKVIARYENGVLEIRVPSEAAALPKKVPVLVGTK